MEYPQDQYCQYLKGLLLPYTLSSFLPVLLGKVGAKIVWGYTKVNASVSRGGNSVGVARLLPASTTGKAAVVL